MQQTTEEKVNELLNEIKTKMEEMRLNAEEVFMNGNCGNLYTIFTEYFPKKAVVPYIISYEGIPHHIVTEIDGDFYDITGKTTLDKYIEYVREHNIAEFDSKDFKMSKIKISERCDKVKKMSDMYEYDESYNQSRISNQMWKLENHINQFKESKSKSE